MEGLFPGTEGLFPGTRMSRGFAVDEEAGKSLNSGNISIFV
jgi:hypothetical protein